MEKPSTPHYTQIVVLFLLAAGSLLKSSRAQDLNSRTVKNHRQTPDRQRPLLHHDKDKSNNPPNSPKPKVKAGKSSLSFGKLWNFLKELWTYINNDRIFAVSAGVAFYGLLSIVPGIAALISIYGLFTKRATVVDQISKISRVLPPEIASIIGDQALRIANQPTQTLGLAVLISFALSLWSSNSATKSTFDALNVVFETREKRGTIGLNLQTIGFTMVGLLLALLAIAASVVLPLVLKYVFLGPIVELLLKSLTWPIFLVVISLAIATLYRFGPSHTHPQWRWATPGVAFATLAWGGMSLLFSWYAASFGKFNETYGSLGAAAVLMTWLWLSALLVLIGAEIDSIIYDRPHPIPQKAIHNT